MEDSSCKAGLFFRLTRIALLLVFISLYGGAASLAKHSEQNHLTIYVSNTASGYGLMQSLVKNYIDQHPEIEIELNIAGGLEVLEFARNDKADLIITHLPASEKLFVDEGYAESRTLIMYNEFVLLAPASADLQKIEGSTLKETLKNIANMEVNFIVPSKRSGTYKKMEELWIMTGIEPDWPGYEILPISSVNLLHMAAEFEYFAFADLGSYISNRKVIAGRLKPFFRDHIALRNYYSALVVSKKKFPDRNVKLAQDFVDYLVSDEGQQAIRRYGELKYGAQVYVPAAHLDEGLKSKKIEEKLKRRMQAIQVMVVMIIILLSVIVLAVWQYYKAKTHEKRRRLSEERFQLAAEGSSDGIWDWNLLKDEAYFSKRMNLVLEREKEKCDVQNPTEVLKEYIDPLDVEKVISDLESCLKKNGSEYFSSDFRVKSALGKEKWVMMRGKVLRDEVGNAVRMSGSITDITESVEQKAEIEYQALHDALTGLPNRTLLLDRLEQMVKGASRSSQSFAVIMMDLNHFKEINDTLGHPVGDEVLKQVAYRLNNILRKSDTIARLGGDEFAILLPGASAMYANHVAKKILLVMKRTIELESHNMYIGASMGISIFPQHGDDPHTLIRHADVAMYVAKREGAGSITYDESQDNDSVRQLKLEKALVDAIKNNSLNMYYQPKIDMSNKTICGVESLVRWSHEELGAISATEIVMIAESRGHINLLTKWALENAIRQIAEWTKEGIDIVVAVNLSAISLKDPDLVNLVRELVEKYRIDTSMLEIEITESAMMSHAENVVELLKKIDAMGIRISIDDFGTGFSSLAYLKKLPVDYIKIDRTFVMGMINDSNDESIVRSTIELAHNLGLKVIAEGVEDKAILNRLVELGCEIVQGFYFSEAVDSKSLLKWINTSPWGFNLSARKKKKQTVENNFTLH